MWPFKKKPKPTDPYKRFAVADAPTPTKSCTPNMLYVAALTAIAAGTGESNSASYTDSAPGNGNDGGGE